MNKAIYGGIAAGMLLVGLVLFQSGNWPTWNAQAIPEGQARSFTLIASEKVVQIAPDNALTPGGIMYNAMVFNGTIPGPPIVVNWGDTVTMTLKNEGHAIHSIDMHAAVGNAQVNSGPLTPGQSKTWTWKAVTPGAFFYHCAADGLNGVWEHLANGMYGGIIVHSPYEKPAKEFYVAFGDMYFASGGNSTGAKSFDMTSFLSGNNALEVTNGMAFKYTPGIGKLSPLSLNKDAKPLMVKPGELTRWYIINAGPDKFLAFHFISGQIQVKDVRVAGREAPNYGTGDTWTIPPGSASVVESTFPAEGPYVGVTHALNDVVKGGAFVVVGSNSSTDTDIPGDAAVPQAGTANAYYSMSSGGSSMTGGSMSNSTSMGNGTSMSNGTSSSGNSTSNSTG